MEVSRIGDIRYLIISPSHGRSGEVSRLLKLIPSAYIAVDSSEEDDYCSAVSRERVISRKEKLVGMGAIRDWVCLYAKERADFLVMMDDDLAGVWTCTHSFKKKIIDPTSILNILESMIQMTEDANTAISGFDYSSSNVVNYSHCKPFVLNGWIGQTYIINLSKYAEQDGVRFDRNFYVSEDNDISLQSLLLDRIILRDSRFCFDYGVMYGNAGGLQGVRNSIWEKECDQLLLQKWGSRNLVFSRDNNGKYVFEGIRVRRKSALAVS